MKYFAFNGPSPHSSIWKDCGGNLQRPQRISATELVGITFEKSAIDDIARGKILEKFPELDIPLMEDKIIKGAQIGDHIICFSTINEKYVSPRIEEDEPIVIDDYEVIAPK